MAASFDEEVHLPVAQTLLNGKMRNLIDCHLPSGFLGKTQRHNILGVGKDFHDV